MSSTQFSSPPPQSDISSIVPGSVFQDDVPPPTFIDGSFDPSPPLGSSPDSNRNSTVNTTDNNHVEIEVNPTIQTVLISLGICVGALFLLGVFATWFITHKNKRAEEKKKRVLEAAVADEKGSGPHSGPSPPNASTEKGNPSGTSNSFEHVYQSTGNKFDMVTVPIDDKAGAATTTVATTNTTAAPTTGVGRNLFAVVQALKGKPNPSTATNSNSLTSSAPGAMAAAAPGVAVATPASIQSPKRSIIGAVGTAVGGGGHAGTGSFQMGASGPRGPGSVNPRNSFIEAAHVYTRRPSITPTPMPPLPSHHYRQHHLHQRQHQENANHGEGHYGPPLKAPTPGYSHDHHHPSAPPGLQLSNGTLYSDDQLGLTRSQDLLASPGFALSPSTFGSMSMIDHPDRNPFMSPPLSAGSKSSLLLDPFRTQNNSQLNLSSATGPDDYSGYGAQSSVGGRGGGGGRGGHDDDGPFPTSPLSAPEPSNSYNTHDHHGYPLNHASSGFSILPSSSSIFQNPPPQSLDDFAEPKLVLRQLQSSSTTTPAYYRHTIMSSNIFDSPTSSSPPSSSGTGSSPGMAFSSSTPVMARPTVERQAGFSPGMVHDRRSIAGSVVVTPGGTNGVGSSSSSSNSSNLHGTAGHGGAGPHGSRHHHASQESINEGNAWYRKRASVIIPDSGSAHVRLWKDGDSSSGSLSGIVINRASRSGSQSSSQSHLSNVSGAGSGVSTVSGAGNGIGAGNTSGAPTVTAPSPLRIHPVAIQQHEDLPKTGAKEEEEGQENDHGKKTRLSPKGTIRNGAAVFEGTASSHYGGSLSRSPSPSRAGFGATRPGTIKVIGSGVLVTEPESDATDTLSSSSLSPSSSGRFNKNTLTVDGGGAASARSKEDEQIDQVVVRLRAPRRGSTHSQNRHSYLDDYRQQQQQQQQ
ncbi:hypothetical protein EDD11_004017 [Mortierella claussenii]|nr:hypothetical protein EDD11_004017 [Mortierella claussenii]